jgi:hypothetical protein
MRLGQIALFCNAFLPGSVGGDLIKAAALARQQSRRTVAVATVIMDRVIALWGLFWFVAILGSFFWWKGDLQGQQSIRLVQASLLVVGLSSVVWVLMGFLPDARAEKFAQRLTAIPRVGGPAAEFWRAAWMYRCKQASVGLALLMSWAGFAGFVTAFYCCAACLHDGDPSRPLPGFIQHFLIVPAGRSIMATPLFPGGAGIGELGFGLLYGWFGFDQSAGVLGSLVQRVFSWLVGLIGYAVYWGTAPRQGHREPVSRPLPPVVEVHPPTNQRMTAS